MSPSSEPRCERTERALTPDELSDLEWSAKENPITVGCSYLMLLVAFGLFPGWVFGLLGRWVGGGSGLLNPQLLEWMGWSIGAYIFFSSIASFRRMSGKMSAMVSADLNAGTVEVLHVHEANSLALGPDVKGNGRIAIQVSSNKILILGDDHGRLFDWQTYSSEPEPESSEWFDGHFNGLPEPNGFPSTQFSLERLPVSGKVLSIRVQGAYRAPEEGGKSQDLGHTQSKWIEGSLDSLRG